MRHTGLFIVILLSLIAEARVEAAVDWIVQSSNGTIIHSGTASSGQAINISLNGLSGAARTIRVMGASNDNIGRITVSGSESSPPEIKLHVDSLSGPPTSMYTSAANAAGVDWAGIVNSYNGDLRVSGCVSGNLTDNFGGGLVFIDFLYFGGAIQDELEGTGGEFMVRAASVASGAHITCRKGDLTLLDIASGSLLADVTCREGEITTILVNGDIGTTLSSPKIWSAKDIISVSGDDVYADIFPGAYVGFGTNRTLDQLVTTGDLGGVARTLGFNTMSIGGSLVGELALKGANPFPSGKTITIGHSLASTGEITVATGSDLGGQVIINKNDSGGTWASGGEVIANPSGSSPITLTAPAYATLSSTLGGGAVGLASYQIHDADCVPANGSTGEPPLDNTLRVRWYGPLQWTTGDPVTVYYRLNPGHSWTDITGDFDFEINPANPRELIVTPMTLGDYDYVQYMVIPTSNLKCAGVTGAPAVYLGGDEDPEQYVVTFEED
jgi:hypothetical protein